MNRKLYNHKNEEPRIFRRQGLRNSMTAVAVYVCIGIVTVKNAPARDWFSTLPYAPGRSTDHTHAVSFNRGQSPLCLLFNDSTLVDVSFGSLNQYRTHTFEMPRITLRLPSVGGIEFIVRRDQYEPGLEHHLFPHMKGVENWAPNRFSVTGGYFNGVVNTYYPKFRSWA